MRVKSLLAVPLAMAMLVLVLQFPAKSSANSLRRGAVFPERIVTPSSPVLLSTLKDDTPVQRQRTVQDELSQVFAAAPTSKGRKGTGDACIGPICGLGLFFASIGLTFVACFVVIYIADKRYDRVHNTRRRHEKHYDISHKRRPSHGHVDFRRNCTGTALRSPSAMRHRAAQ
ncbi:hypothetical protein PF005_g1607 [Phytophthora fragariae]|uniref:RxLR effector protein n=1 Tax=Phytophthora fragariae TaxID=53985 RepID=A0A6A3MBB5_9STRA|nr:hypothetical protein PF003_g19892 [Phytophthora fragariae]KAE8948813.1 hypothetical protein PF009_g1631 [Phytophthora fragariae]KAE9029561.1 hypothetical protein PF011_g1006 [Phytophthora fragariae]KAE9137675.1 hypothetical protein PF010_g1254 [Phytophthora fragariae]KAE9138046.1 hypothetical protein PF007_g1583 [Phytophthora fragariae]